MSFLRLAVGCLLIGAAPAATAAPFQNLDFEQADPERYLAEGYAADALLPGWTVGGVSNETDLYDVGAPLGPSYDVSCLGSRCVSVHDGEGPYGSYLPIAGDFSLLIQGGTFLSGRIWVEQIGEIPADARAIEFLAVESRYNGDLIDLRITVDGQDLPVYWGEGVEESGLRSSGLPFSRQIVPLWADIAAFAGQEVALQIGVEARPFAETDVLIDEVRFTLVPEPGTGLLVGAGAWVLGAGRRRRA